MSVGFGFSAGDFIAALQLVSTVIDALRDSGESSAEYRALLSQLFTLETALLKVKRLEVDDEQHAECQATIDAFWEKIKKYQLSLRERGTGSRVKDGWRKIRWALCKKDDLVKFKADLVGHTESIDLLLMTLHMGSTRIESKRREENYRTRAGKMQEGYFGCMQKLSSVICHVSTGVEQGKKLLEMTARVIRTNLDVFHIVLNIQSTISKMPGQVERQQPIYFVDALGRHMPFNLEFILSAEALTHVLKSNFKNIGSGSQKIKRGEFAIQDTVLKSDIDLTGPWERCFRPGQRVDMSMVFVSKKSPSNSCPGCKEDNGNDFEEDQDIECKMCGVTFRRTVTRVFDIPEMILPPSARYVSSPILGCRRGQPLKRKRENDEDAEMALFRRVRVKTSVVLSSKASQSSLPEIREIVGDFSNNFGDDIYPGPHLHRRLPSIKGLVSDKMLPFKLNSEPEHQDHGSRAQSPGINMPEIYVRDPNPSGPLGIVSRSKFHNPTSSPISLSTPPNVLIPPSLPPPRHILDIAERENNEPDIPWKWANSYEDSSDVSVASDQPATGKMYMEVDSKADDAKHLAQSNSSSRDRWSRAPNKLERQTTQSPREEHIGNDSRYHNIMGKPSGPEIVNSPAAGINTQYPGLTGSTEGKLGSDRMRNHTTLYTPIPHVDEGSEALISSSSGMNQEFEVFPSSSRGTVTSHTPSALFGELPSASISFPGVSAEQLQEFLAASTAAAVAHQRNIMDWTKDDDLSIDYIR